MRLNDRMNFVVPIYRDGPDPAAWVHSTPISNEVFESNWVLLSRTFTVLMSQGLGSFMVGPKVAKLALRDVAAEISGSAADADTVSSPFLNEVRRLSSVMIPVAGVWDTIPLQEAERRKLLTEDEIRTTESQLAFFMLGWHLYPPQERQFNLDGAARIWGAQMSSLNSTAFAASLRTSRELETTTETVTNPPVVGAGVLTGVGPDGLAVTLSLPS